MKLDQRQIAGFLRDPGACRVVLLYGDDEGLIRERAVGLIKFAAGDLHDPFRVTELSKDQWDQLNGEMASFAMMGGRRAIRLRDITDAATDAVRSALAGKGEALAVLEAPGLGKGKIRTFVEGAKDAVAIGCYPEEGKALESAVRDLFRENGVSVDAEALAWICENLGGDRAMLRNEVEKLALYAGAGGMVGIETAQLCAGEGANLAADAGLLAATSGDLQAADSGTERALAEGLNGIALLRMALSHLQKLHLARMAMEEDGMSASDAVRTIRPPVFFRAVPGMTTSVSRWPAEALLRAIEEARQVELASKRTGAAQELLARRYIAWLARQSAARGRRLR